MQPSDSRFPSEPGALAFRVLSRRCLRQLDCFVKADLTVDVKEALTVSDGFQRFGIGAETHRKYRAHFVDKTALEHADAPCVDPFRQLLARWIEPDLQNLESVERAAIEVVHRRDRRSGYQANLQGADQFVRVVSMNTGCSFGIQACEQTVKRPWLAAAESSPNFGIARRTLKETVEKRTKIESSPADDDGDATSRGDLTKRRATGPLVIASGKYLVGIRISIR